MSNNIIVQFTQDEFTTLLKACITESLELGDFTKAEPSDKLFNVKEAAEYLDIASQTLYGYTSNRAIPFIKKGKKLYFKKSDLNGWLNAGKRDTIEGSKVEIIKKLRQAKYDKP